MRYCPTCRKMFDEEKCPVCRNAGKASPEPEELVHLVTLSGIEIGLLEGALEEAGIEAFKKTLSGVMSIYAGSGAEKCEIYVRSRSLKAASVILDGILPSKAE